MYLVIFLIVLLILLKNDNEIYVDDRSNNIKRY